MSPSCFRCTIPAVPRRRLERRTPGSEPGGCIPQPGRTPRLNRTVFPRFVAAVPDPPVGARVMEPSPACRAGSSQTTGSSVRAPSRIPCTRARTKRLRFRRIASSCTQAGARGLRGRGTSSSCPSFRQHAGARRRVSGGARRDAGCRSHGSWTCLCGFSSCHGTPPWFVSWRLVRGSNPRSHLERVVTWATSRTRRECSRVESSHRASV